MSAYPNRGHTDLQDYYDVVPPAHRLSGYGSFGSSSTDIPLMTQSSSLSTTRTQGDSNPSYISPFDSNHAISRSDSSSPAGGAGPGAAVGAGAGVAAAAATDSRAELDNFRYQDEPGLREGPYARNDGWMEKSAAGGLAARASRRKWWIIGGVAALVLIIVAVVVGVVVSQKNRSSSSSSSPQLTQNGDPSDFTKDTRLIQSFWGLAYTPEGSQLPDCGNKLEDVITDIQLLSQLTTRIRLYGADCNQSALVLEAIKQTKVNMSVWLGNYVAADDAGVAYERQRDTLKQAIEDYGTDHIEGITVGNEFMLNYLNANGATDPNSAVGSIGAQALILNITDTRQTLAGMALTKTLQVGTADAGSFFNNIVLSSVDYGMSNVHPWFANVSVDAAADWTAQFFQETNVDVAQTLANQPEMYIAETGWPTKSSDAGNENNGASDASVANLQMFLDTFVCQANTNGTGYFFFEYTDEEWKDQQFGGVEGWWGLFNQDRTLKDGLTIPTCS